MEEELAKFLIKCTGTNNSFEVFKSSFNKKYVNYITGSGEYSISCLYGCLDPVNTIDEKCYKILEFILENEADPNLSLKFKRPYRTRSPSHLLIAKIIRNKTRSKKVESFGLKILELLIQKGANLNIKDWKGFTPLDLAVFYKNRKIYNLLKKYNGLQTNAPFSNKNFIFQPYIGKIQDNIWNENYSELNKFIDKFGINTIFSDEPYFEYTLLFISVQGSPESTKFLLENGADPNITVNDDKAALHQFLDGIKDYYDEDEPEKWTLEPFIETIKIFIKYGANLNIKDYNGDTPLDIASFYNFDEICELLGKNGAKRSKDL